VAVSCWLVNCFSSIVLVKEVEKLNYKKVTLHKEDVERLNSLKEEARLAFKDAGIVTDEELKEYYDI